MEGNSISKYTVSFGISLAVSSVLNALLVIVKEESPSVAQAMTRLTGHHWVTHSGLVLVVFLLGGWLFSLANGGRGLRISPDRLIVIIAAGVVTGGALIMGFYLVAD